MTTSNSALTRARGAGARGLGSTKREREEVIGIYGKRMGMRLSMDTTIGELLRDLRADDRGSGGMIRLHVDSNEGSKIGLVLVVIGESSIEEVEEKINEVAVVWRRRNRERPTALH